ncbi:MAG TPA: sensor domain-containing diguanylate cyclase [Nevskiaceae bacterium]|nr:sensor domain-containing diguanylate cyclase [Nevskiaceae bacterium]
MTSLLLLTTLILTWQVDRLIAARQALRFDDEVTRVEWMLRQRADAYAQVLRSAAAYVVTAPRPPSETWSRYVASLDLPAHLPGFRSLEVVDARSPIEITPARRDVMNRAARAGTVTLSERLPATIGGKADEARFLMAAPLRDGSSIAGWIVATLEADAFSSSLLGGASPLQFEVYDGARLEASALLHPSGGVTTSSDQDFPVARPIEVLGRSWILRYRAPAQFVPITDRLVPFLAFAGGILATWLFYLIARSAAVVRQQANHDALTGLANRGLFMNRVQAATEASRRVQRHFALVFIDIDGFKAVNDRHGHRAGDELLKAIAGRLKHGMRHTDLLARLGGDEFAAILCGGTDPQSDAAHYGQRVVEQIAKPFTLALPDGDVRVSVGASVGIAVHPLHGDAWDALLVAADEAMYRAKRSGKGRCVLAGEVLA